SDPATYIEVGDAVQADGSFVLDRARLASVNGGTLNDAGYTLHLIARDAGGSSSDSVSVAFTLDTAAPTAPTVDLTEASDTGTFSDDNVTKDATPTLALHSEAGALFTLKQDGSAIGSALSGPDATTTTGSLSDGDHTFTAIAEDLAGNVSTEGTLKV